MTLCTRTNKKKMMQLQYYSIDEMIIDDLIKSLNKFKFQKFVKMTELHMIKEL